MKTVKIAIGFFLAVLMSSCVIYPYDYVAYAPEPQTAPSVRTTPMYVAPAPVYVAPAPVIVGPPVFFGGVYFHGNYHGGHHGGHHR
ncbi:hypothetical protein LLG95_00970 [bacterium]|nr:hypothetical protein [bacterium]